MTDRGRKKAALPSQTVAGHSSPAGTAPVPGAPPRLLGPSDPAAGAFAASNSWWPRFPTAGPVPLAADWENDVYPPGGFVNYLRNPSSFIPSHHIPPQQPMSQDYQFMAPPKDAPKAAPKKKPSGTSSKRAKKPINVEIIEDDEEDNTIKRLLWTPDEDERLMSAWLKNSNDPISDRRRQATQAINRWHRVNKMINNFHAIHGEISAIYASGQSDQQLMKKVHKAYESRHGGPFLLESTWEVVRHFPKWTSYNEELNGSKKRDVADLGVAGKQKPADNDDIKRPKGTKVAKAERDGKGKGNVKAEDLEELEKFYKVQMEATKSRTDVLEAQKRIAADKLESSRLILLAAKEKKEAKTKAKMLEQYGKLMTQDLREMSDVQKAEYVIALKLMREELFSKQTKFEGNSIPIW
ncbi:hypothetical protein ACQ4PT_026080 [Festuca glaucescens]